MNLIISKSIATAMVKKDEKVREINQLYQNAKQEGDKNPYNIVQHNFNYPQFYQLQNGKMAYPSCRLNSAK